MEMSGDGEEWFEFFFDFGEEREGGAGDEDGETLGGMVTLDEEIVFGGGEFVEGEESSEGDGFAVADDVFGGVGFDFGYVVDDFFDGE